MTSTKQQPVTSEEFPALTISIPPSSISLHLKMTSTMGSRAQLADVPKLHELIETQVRLLRLQMLCSSDFFLHQGQETDLGKGNVEGGLAWDGQATYRN